MNSYNIGLEDRKIIEEMYNAGAKPCEIAARIGKCQATIYREITVSYTHLTLPTILRV